MPDRRSPEDLLDEQLDYYRQSAAEMDAGARRVLEVDTTEYAHHARLATAEAVAWVQDGVSGKDTLEIAAGTGLYTRVLAGHASVLTALDASPESLDINRAHAKAAGHEVEFLCDDIFTWCKLSDGRRFRIVRIAWPRDELSDRLAGIGWVCTLPTGTRLLLGRARRSGDPVGHYVGDRAQPR